MICAPSHDHMHVRAGRTHRPPWRHMYMLPRPPVTVPPPPPLASAVGRHCPRPAGERAAKGGGGGGGPPLVLPPRWRTKAGAVCVAHGWLGKAGVVVCTHVACPNAVSAANASAAGAVHGRGGAGCRLLLCGTEGATHTHGRDAPRSSRRGRKPQRCEAWDAAAALAATGKQALTATCCSAATVDGGRAAAVHTQRAAARAELPPLLALLCVAANALLSLDTRQGLHQCTGTCSAASQ